MIKPLWDRVMIKAPEKSEAGLLHLPRKNYNSDEWPKHERGRVVAVGKGARTVKAGWDAYFTRNGPVELLTHEGVDYWLILEAMVVARVEPGE